MKENVFENTFLRFVFNTTIGIYMLVSID